MAAREATAATPLRRYAARRSRRPGEAGCSYLGVPLAAAAASVVSAASVSLATKNLILLQFLQHAFSHCSHCKQLRLAAVASACCSRFSLLQSLQLAAVASAHCSFLQRPFKPALVCIKRQTTCMMCCTTMVTAAEAAKIIINAVAFATKQKKEEDAARRDRLKRHSLAKRAGEAGTSSALSLFRINTIFPIVE
jgi:hypothetical protein